ncbi:MAG: integration host factor subunit beta [Rickettsiales bacterium]|nr:integration host factor subunit beta [Rickettsiales bacterium]|tara:strand:- start:500 stop:787 length:288 start_codon:yes stop_codon:yes gene_type:complete
MTRSELIQRLNQKYPHLYQRDIETLVTTILNEISEALAREERVELRGFGAFSIRRRDPRVARNPKNGEKVKVDERRAIYFRTGKELRERINNKAS